MERVLIVNDEEIDTLLSSYENEENNVVQILEPQNIFKAFWEKSGNKPEPTGRFKKIIENEEVKLLF